MLAPSSAALPASLAATSGVDGVWDPLPAFPYASSAAIYDSLRDRLLLIGGYASGAVECDVWALDLESGTAWVPLPAQGTPPSARAGLAAIYDRPRDRVIVYGSYGVNGDTAAWSLDLAGAPTWTKLMAAGPTPPPRDRCVAAYDPMRDRMLVFGGAGPLGFLNDVWALSLAGAPTWSQLSPQGTPPTPRLCSAGIYDPVRDRLIIHGGGDAAIVTTGGGARSDLWALELSDTLRWRRLWQGAGGADSYQQHTAVYDAMGDRMLVYGGLDSTWYPETYHREVRAWSLADDSGWATLLVNGPDPGNRRNHVAILDPVRERLVIEGGWTADTWRLDLAVAVEPMWIRWLDAPALPPLRFGHVATYDAPRDRILVFGGRYTSYLAHDWTTIYRDDLWALDLSGTPTWSVVAASGGLPPARQNASAIHDLVRDRLVLFGGSFSSGVGRIHPLGYPHYFGDVWTLDLAGTPAWSPLVALGPGPGPRDGQSAVYAPDLDAMIVFGGRDSLGPKNDLWVLSLSAPVTWSALVPAGGPPPRYAHAAGYDPVRHVLVISGGLDGAGARTDSWLLQLGGTPAWSEMHPSGTAPAQQNFRPAVYDPARTRLLVFGEGPNDGGGLPMHVWELALRDTPRWRPLDLGADRPEDRYGHSGTWDPVRGRAVILWGTSAIRGEYEHGDHWILRPDGATPAMVSLARATASPERVEIRWYAAWGIPAAAVERREPASDWQRLGTIVADGSGRLSYVDRAVKPGARYGYRLGWLEGGREQFSAETWVTVPLGPAFALERPRPNPAAGAFEISFLLPDAAPARLEVLDVAGRRVESRDVGALGAGLHLMRMGAERPLGPGLYVVRLARCGVVRTARACVIR